MVDSIDHIDRALVAKLHPSMYEMHMYRARKPHNVVAEYITRYTDPDDVVLDPFCGSGVAPIEAIKHDRRAIGIDLNPMATFVSRMTATPVDLDEYEAAFETVASRARSDILDLYATTCPTCGERRHANQIVWEGGSSLEGGRPTTIRYACPDCAAGQKRYAEKDPDDDDMARLETIASRDIPYWYPTQKLRYSDGTPFRDGTHDEGRDSIADLFTKRNLLALSLLRQAIDHLPAGDVKDLMWFTFTGTIHLGSRLLPARKSRGGPVWTQHRFWLPDDFWERNVWQNFATRFERVRRGKLESNDVIERYEEADSVDDVLAGRANVMWVTDDARGALSEFDDDVVDYVFADPSYGGSVQYGELNYLWASWLGHGEDYLRTMTADEIVVNDRQDKSLESYRELLSAVVTECSRVSKPDRRMTVTFHNPSFDIRDALVRTCYTGGYDLEDVVWQPPARIPSKKRHLQPHGSVRGDFYFRFANAETVGRRPSADPDAFERIVRETATRVLAERGEPTPMSIVTNAIEPALAEDGFPVAPDRSVADVILDPDDDRFVVYGADGDEMDRRRTRKLTDKTLWLQQPTAHLSDHSPLGERIEMAVYRHLLDEDDATFEAILRELYAVFRRECTPAPSTVKAVLDEYAERNTDGTWSLSARERRNVARRRELLARVTELGRRSDHGVRIAAENHRVNGNTPIGRDDGRTTTACSPIDDIEDPTPAPDVLWTRDGRIHAGFDLLTTAAITTAAERMATVPEDAHAFVLAPEDRFDRIANRLRLPAFTDRFENDVLAVIPFDEFDVTCDERNGASCLGAIEAISRSPTVLLDDRVDG